MKCNSSLINNVIMFSFQVINIWTNKLNVIICLLNQVDKSTTNFGKEVNVAYEKANGN